MSMNVLVACEFSGVVRRAFRAKGHNAWSIDLLPSSDDSPFHAVGDLADGTSDAVFKLWKAIREHGPWDLLIAHPPCTFMANSGVRWLHTEEGRWDKLKEACEFFNMLKDAPVERICIENPIPHKYAREHIGKYTQIVHPWQHGHGESKATCLWLKGLPELQPTNIVEGREQRSWLLGPSPDRWKLRSTTYQGIAEAMAEQWG